jgi:N-acyl-D-aspartate/D-glutamate deacylase
MTHLVRDRQRCPRLQLEKMVQRQTHKTAEQYGLTDHGE